MKKLLELLGVEKLDESTQDKVKTQLQDIIDIKAKEISESKLSKEKDKLIENYENKFNEYKEEITSKFSNFVDSILEEEMIIPDKILDYARKGELYNELIEQFKVRMAIDEGLLDGEVKSLLKEAREEIIKLREDLDEKSGKELEIELENQKLSAEIYIRKKCDGLSEQQKSYVIDVLGDLTDIEEIDRKFEIVVESSKKKVTEEDDDEEDGKKSKKKVAEEEDEEEEENESSKKKVTEEDDDEEENESTKGKGKSEIEEEEKKEKVDESGSPFQNYIQHYVKTLKEGKI